MYADRLNRLTQSMSQQGFDAVVINPGSTLTYLTGLSFHLMERPILAIFSIDHKPLLVTPELESAKAETCVLDLDLITYGEDMTSRTAAVKKACKSLNHKDRRVGVEPLRMRVMELRLLEENADKVLFSSADSVLSELRLKKDPSEVETMRRAANLAENALLATIPLIRLGMSERELESELTIQLLRAGSEPELPFQPIVASGPNSALPHATPTERALQAGDLLILDWGARLNGYISDITRTFAIDEIDPELQTIYNLVQAANQAGKDAVHPGASCCDVDRAARQVIDDAGYGGYFIHRTGHGIGLEAHEPPYIHTDNQRTLEPGMTFTVEPGIYLPGRGGVRIEDDVLVTSDGVESFTTYSQNLEVIP